jgi:nitroimidazol reductase NimA-like FMN-containing flavoprotein (pyridoxamine 5'-phosphate oxidase superfamily)
MRKIRRHRERATDSREALNDLLDAVPFGSLSTVVDGGPWVVPMLFARCGDRIILHGSTGAGALRHVASGASAALCVTALDGIVVGPTAFSSSANYRSAVVEGVLTPLEDVEQAEALEAFLDRLIPGRSDEVRPNTDKELATTLTVALPIVPGQWTLKARSGPPAPPEEPTQAWTGVVPLTQTWGPPAPSPWVPAEAEVPPSVRRLCGIRDRTAQRRQPRSTRYEAQLQVLLRATKERLQPGPVTSGRSA